MYCVDGKIYIEDDDQCIDCKNYAVGVACPLLMALGQGVVYMEDSLTVRDCGFYVRFSRHLHVVRNNGEEK
ncbi:MAG: hypothetical protein LBK53_09100 [Heliobacteriaceae bacterium]|jgi:hypothetical protein|nr:hypothetical protein [Heliobacteriaceae bacterium]